MKNFVLLIAVTLLVVGSNIAIYEFSAINNKTDSFGIQGSFALYKNGHLVYQSDQITYIGYSTAICKLFNDTQACFQSDLAWGSLGSGSHIGTGCNSGQNHQLSDSFYSSAFCTMTGIGLTDSASSWANGSPPIGGNCPSIITTNGMSPTQATTSFSGNTQTVTLSVSWTASGSQSFNGACVIAWNDLSGGATYWTGNINAFAMQAFTTQTVSNGQTWSAQWTFNF
jgi:hypothetical protein